MELLPSCVFILIILFGPILFGKAQQYEITLDECSSDLLKSYEDVVNHWWNDLKRISHLDNKKYIHKLVSFVCTNGNKSNCGIIIGGPRDSGKTNGLVFLSEAAKKLGHNVFHINLKSVTSSLDVEDILHRFSWNIMNAIQNMEDTDTLQCVYNNIVKCHQIEQSWAMVIEWIKGIAAALGIIVATVFAVIPSYVRFPKPTWILMLLAVFYFLCWAIPNFSVTVMYYTYFSGTLIKERIALGKWNTIFCCLDAIGSCKSRKPILAIRDVNNFPNDQLHAFLV